MENSPPSSSIRRSAAWRWTQAGLLIALILMGCAWLGQRLAQRVADLTPEQLQEAMLAQQPLPVEKAIEQVNRLSVAERRSVMTSPAARTYLQKLSTPERAEFVRRTLDRGIRENIERYRKLAPEERTVFVQELRQQQQQARENMDKLSPEEKERVREFVHTADLQDTIERAMKTYLSVSTSAERADLAPLYDGALENLDHARNLR